MNYKPLSTCFGIAFVFFYPCFSRFSRTMALCAILLNFDFFEISKSRPDKNSTVSKTFSQQNYELLKIPMQKIWVKILLWIKSYSLRNSFIFKSVKLTMLHPVYPNDDYVHIDHVLIPGYLSMFSHDQRLISASYCHNLCSRWNDINCWYKQLLPFKNVCLPQSE